VSRERAHARRDALIGLLRQRHISFVLSDDISQGSASGGGRGGSGGDQVGQPGGERNDGGLEEGAESQGGAGHEKLVLMDGLCTIEAPYTEQTCYCSSALVLERVCALLEELDGGGAVAS
jgi:hypothetical protein